MTADAQEGRRTPARVAHDLNNVFTAIITHCHLLRDEAPTPEIRADAAEILRAALDGAGLVAELRRLLGAKPPGPNDPRRA
ncbi:MAG: hypothetical protein PHU25_19700 [Deltaproteobacteria bacterium]|nr:hypothetical protein [Deltaproteobacteria bacterium]